MELYINKIIFITKLRKKGVVVKENPKNKNQYIVSYYNKNKLSYLSITPEEAEEVENKVKPNINSLKLGDEYFFGNFVLLKNNYTLARIEKINPTYTDEFVVSYYENNKLNFSSITERDLLPIKNYDIIRNRRNLINLILRD